MLTKLPFDLETTQCLSLQDFPHVKVKFDDQPSSNPRGNIYSSYYDNTKDVCNDLGIMTEHDWPIDPVKPPNPEFTRDGNSICHDSVVGEPMTSPKVADLYTLPNLSAVLNKISPHHVVTVAVLDTGILSCHKDFAGKIVAMKNFVPNEDNDFYYNDYNGHGTHCAGIMLQTAPFARLVICKVLSSFGQTNQSKWIADAIDWLLNDEEGPKTFCPVDIISMSLGGGLFNSDLKRAVSEAGAQGKVVLAAATNDGRKGMTNIAFPARFGDVICVGSHDRFGQPSLFSSVGRELDFLAPGEDILAPSSRGNYQRMSGTSQATPTVAGITAIVISYAETVGTSAQFSC
ncbi:subtilisin-like [Branchiostoma floridae]|uniref:Subtilisin-like n=1 Tax=Branchiostoma floridae TaxID=7739 RepID=A0A9J7HJD8_BRAFL|nr:subtilisin-like [Branchiostoma floridae]